MIMAGIAGVVCMAATTQDPVCVCLHGCMAAHPRYVRLSPRDVESMVSHDLFEGRPMSLALTRVRQGTGGGGGGGGGRTGGAQGVQPSALTQTGEASPDTPGES